MLLEEQQRNDFIKQTGPPHWAARFVCPAMLSWKPRTTLFQPFPHMTMNGYILLT